MQSHLDMTFLTFLHWACIWKSFPNSLSLTFGSWSTFRWSVRDGDLASFFCGGKPGSAPLAEDALFSSVHWLSMAGYCCVGLFWDALSQSRGLYFYFYANILLFLTLQLCSVIWNLYCEISGTFVQVCLLLTVFYASLLLGDSFLFLLSMLLLHCYSLRIPYIYKRCFAQIHSPFHTHNSFPIPPPLVSPNVLWSL